MEPTLGDSHDRFKWRSKATLDYIFLMIYARTRGKYFVQLEDDIITKPNFVTVMRETADTKSAKNETWFVIAFSDLGFIGKKM
jgi:alpha-1,3-mannosylglycoprotein beta-1,4-N-acetylglucosaminyltransferase A/B